MPKIVDHDLYRKELLQGCLALFAEQGYRSITMRQIAAGLGVSTGTLYHYFPSKESIFMQLVQELCEQDISNFLAQEGAADSLEARLKDIMAFVLKNLQYYHQQLLLWVDFSQQAPKGSEVEAQFLRQVWNRGRDAIADYLQVCDPNVVDLIMVFGDGLVIQFLYGRDFQETEWFEKQCQLLVQMVVYHEQHFLETQT